MLLNLKIADANLKRLIIKTDRKIK